jgi:hypothetical protein
MGKPKTNNDELKKELEDLEIRVSALEVLLGVGKVQTEDSSNPPQPPPPPPH